MMRRGVVAIALALPLLLSAAGPNSYEQGVLEFHHRRDVSLKNNWATLAGLSWLNPGSNSVGADERARVVLPKGTAPSSAGTMEVAGDQVTLKLAPAVKGSIGGKPITGPVKMLADTSGSPTKVELASGRLRMWVIQRGQRIGVRVQDLQSPESKNYKPSIWFPTDPQWKVTAQWVPNANGRKVLVPDIIGDVNAVPIAGEARFNIGGQSASLVGLDNGDGSVEFVFADPTNKKETYPAGRFLDADIPSSGSAMVLDFNMAYNPPCSVTAYATCPLPPKENKLPVAVTAGQKFDRKAHPGH